MKWRSRRRNGEPGLASARSAAAIIGDVFATIVAEQREEVIRCEVSLRIARRGLTEAEAQQLGWQRNGTFDHVLGVRALLMAQIADLDHRTQPPGANLAGMLVFLQEHHPSLAANSDVLPPGAAQAEDGNGQ